MISLLSVID